MLHNHRNNYSYRGKISVHCIYVFYKKKKFNIGTIKSIIMYSNIIHSNPYIFAQTHYSVSKYTNPHTCKLEIYLDNFFSNSFSYFQCYGFDSSPFIRILAVSVTVKRMQATYCWWCIHCMQYLLTLLFCIETYPYSFWINYLYISIAERLKMLFWQCAFWSWKRTFFKSKITCVQTYNFSKSKGNSI